MLKSEAFGLVLAWSRTLVSFAESPLDLRAVA